MIQTVLTFISTIDPAKRKGLEDILTQIRLNLTTNTYVPFPAISLVHFASFVIVDTKNESPLLVFENNFDGELDDYLDQLASVVGTGLHQIYSCCADYPTGNFDPQVLKKYLTAKVVRPGAYHIGNVGRMAKDARNNRQLRMSVETFLDQSFPNTQPVTLSADAIHSNIQNYVKTVLPPELSSQLPPHQTFSEKVIPWIKLIIFGLLFLSTAIILFPVTILIIVILRRKEDSDFIETTPQSVTNIEQLSTTENQITQNHLASVTTIKPGKFRLNLLKSVLYAVNLVARVSTKGKLSGIPSIHFAHWSIIDNDRQLLFLSNFDGSWASYLDDFIDKAATGLTGVWTNTYGFPYTKFLVMQGARNELGFKTYARNHQAPSLVWYSAYSDLTVQNIDKDSKIREQLFEPLSADETQQWLQLF